MASPSTRSADAASGVASGASGRKSGLWACLLVLTVLLISLFHRSFENDQVIFSNDGPLGAIVSQADTAYQAFTGHWRYLTWIGHVEPSALPNVTQALFLLIGPAVLGPVAGSVAFAKFYVPLTLLILGLCAWLFFRQQGFHSTVAVMGALAAALNTDPFSYACWGLASIALCLAAAFAALGLATRTPRSATWARLCLVGLCVGMAVMEGYDVGAILSLYVAAFLVFQAWVEESAPVRRFAKGAGRVAVVALFAVLVSAHALSTLIGTQIKDIAGAQQDAKTKEQRWDEATMWSLPKIETLRVMIPGLFGYRMDTPDGGNYWGSVGQSPGVPQSRHSGSGVYAGVFVVLLAGFSLTQAARKKDSPFTEKERKHVWFWAGAALISLLLAFGRHAPFYQFFYGLPYFSTIRNPIKFMHPFSVALVILFGYGLEALWRRYLAKSTQGAGSVIGQLKFWWPTAPSRDKRWTVVTVFLVGAGVLGWLLYASARSELLAYLQRGGFSVDLASEMASFSVREVGWFVLFLALGVVSLTLALSGGLSGPRAKWAGLLFGLLLVGDLVRGNSPWIVYYNYKDKYASNPVVDFLQEHTHQDRVAARLSPLSPTYLAQGEGRSLLAGVAEEWLQQDYQYYRIQSLDIIQMPRMPELDASYLGGMNSPYFSASDFPGLGAFVSKLTNHSDAVSQLVWQQLSPQARTALTLSAGSNEIAPILSNEMNRLIGGPSIHEPTLFAGIKLSEDTQALLGQNLPAREMVRLNRLLLQDAYPAELARRTQLAAFGRLWQLTNTRYVLGMTAFLDVLNQQIDPINRSFRVQTAFDFAPRESAAASGGRRVEDITTILRSQGQFAVFEFQAALPRAKLFSDWQVITNDSAVLQRLFDPAFNPQTAVLVADALPAAVPSSTAPTVGNVSITRYEPKSVTLRAESAAPAVLLLNDRYDPNWKVTVDGQPAPLLRCNYIMRGVYLKPGQHQVEFHFDPPHWTLYVSLAAIGMGVLLCGVLALGARTQASAEVPASTIAAPVRTKT